MGIMIEKNFNLHHLRMLQLFWPNDFLEEIFYNFLCIYSFMKFNLPLWPNPTHGNHDWKKNLNQHHLRMLSQKFQLFLSNDFWLLKNTRQFSIIPSHLPLKDSVAVILVNLNLLQPMMPCAKFGWKLAQWLWRRNRKCK